MLTAQLYVVLSSAIKGEPQATGNLYIAVGSGEPGWDQVPPVYQRDITQLIHEVARKPVAPEDVVYLDGQNNPTDNVPTTRLLITAAFGQNEGEGTLRECGLYGGDATQTPDSGSLLSYFVHPRINKGPNMVLNRRFTLDFSPSTSAPGQVVTRFLGNSNSRELHDLQNETAACQINEILFDRRIYFTNAEQAIALGYDRCAFCFGRELSQR